MREYISELDFSDIAAGIMAFGMVAFSAFVVYALGA